MKVSVIVCAAGRGQRAGFDKNKLLVPFFGATPLYYTLKAFDGVNLGEDAVIQKIAVCARGDTEAAQFCESMGWTVVNGGKTRTESVYNALQAVTGDIALIHDGARPFVTQEIIKECVKCAKEYGSAICATPATDTTAIAEDGYITSIPQRSTVFCVQTPQAFYAKDIKCAYEKAIRDGQSYTDDGSVYSRYCRPAKLCACGTPQNRKLTYAQDFEEGACYPSVSLPSSGGVRTGFGVDVHAFGKEQNFITLCGVKIPCDTGLIAHSDGDVAVHAIMDALLSGAGLKDIGNYFPDTDEKYRGADSMELLERVVSLIAEKGYSPAALAVAIQAEKPRLSPHIDEMKEKLAAATGLTADRIAVSAGTCEGLGFVGEKRGICVYCTAALKIK